MGLVSLLLQVTPEGYLFIITIFLAIGMARFWMVKKKKSGTGRLIFHSVIFWFIIFWLFVLSLQLAKLPNVWFKVAIAVIWILFAGVFWLVSSSKKIKSALPVYLYIFYAAGGLMLLGMIGGMSYFVYQRLFTHEKDDAPMWAVLLCIFFLGMLLIVFVGNLLKGKTANKDSKTDFDNLNEALRTPEEVIHLSLVSAQLTVFPNDILKFINLNTLDLSNNQLSTLPQEISDLKHLSSVRLSGNPITDTERASLRRTLSPELELIFRKNTDQMI